ncbi:MAG: MurR/RpiR family transcriptional regulator [Desulfobaccales bacterium]|jgi:DNA-binding MurR/RpiR family transcriptional regulator
MEKSNPEDRGRDLQSGALIRLRGIYPSLKAALQKVACLILSQPEMAIYASVNEVAAAARVSEATVMRFWRILGYKGFQDFKISLARELVVPPPRLPEDGGPTALVRWIFKANLAALEETLEVVEMRQLLQAGELLGKCRRLIIGGFRGSGLAAQYAAVRFPRLGLELRCFTETYQMAISAALLGREGALLAISHSGSTHGILASARVAKDSGARVLAITSNPLAPLSRIADLVLVTAGREMTAAPDCLAAFLSQISIIDSLATLMKLARPDEARANLAKIERVLSMPV